MKLFKSLFMLLAVFTVTSNAVAAEAYIGTFLYQYKPDTTYRVTVPDSQHMHWVCVQGPEKGASGDEKPQRFKVDDRVFFTTWVEKTGINVTQVVDLKRMKVYSTILDGKERYVLEGTIIREK